VRKLGIASDCSSDPTAVRKTVFSTKLANFGDMEEYDIETLDPILIEKKLETT